MKFLVPNYSCLQNPWLGGYHPQDPNSLCPQLNLLNSPPSPKKIPGYATEHHHPQKWPSWDLHRTQNSLKPEVTTRHYALGESWRRALCSVCRDRQVLTSYGEDLAAARKCTRTHARVRARKCHFQNTDWLCFSPILAAACSHSTELHARTKFIPHGRFAGSEMTSGNHKVRSSSSKMLVRNYKAGYTLS